MLMSASSARCGRPDHRAGTCPSSAARRPARERNDGAARQNAAIVRRRSLGGILDHPLDACRFRALGGSTTHWGGWRRPLDAIDFEMRDWIVNSGWPFAKQCLDTFYARAHSTCRLGPYEDDPARWKGAHATDLVSPGEASFQDAVFQIQPTRFGAVNGAAAQCSPTVALVLNANIVEVAMDRSRRAAVEVHAATLTKRVFSVAADRFVLAAEVSRTPASCLRRAAVATAASEMRTIWSAATSSITCTCRSG